MIAATSLATPHTLKQSLRLGVNFKVVIRSLRSSAILTSVPFFKSWLISKIPSASSLNPNSFKEQSIPNDSTPRTLASLISIAGNLAPTKAHATLMPCLALEAPQTICNVLLPIFTSQTWSRSASGCFLMPTISPTTTSLKDAPRGWESSTSRPAIIMT